MTKEQEETFEKVNRIRIDFFDSKYKDVHTDDELEEKYEALGDVLNMLKEKDKEIENKKKALDNLENELNRLSERNLELFEESFEARKKNEYWESRIKQGREDVKGLKLYEIGIVCEDLKEEIEKKDKIIDLMCYAMTHEDVPQNEYCICRDMSCEVVGGNKACKDCIKQYFERKVE